VHRPWIPEPGICAQYDFGDGPLTGQVKTTLFCLRLTWSRYRVVLPLPGKMWQSVASAVDVALRQAGGCRAYLLTDNEKTVTTGHVAGLPVRNPAAACPRRPDGSHSSQSAADCPHGVRARDDEVRPECGEGH